MQWKIYAAGGFGKLIYTEGEYNHTSEPARPRLAPMEIGAETALRCGIRLTPLRTMLL